MNLNDLRRIAGVAGIRGACYDIGYRIGRRLVQLRILRGLVLTPETLDRSALAIEIPYRHGFLAADVVRRYADFPGLELSRSFVDHALDKGDRCYGVEDGDRLVSYSWYARNSTPVTDELSLRFDPAWIYMYKGFTSRAYRGQRLYAFGMAHALTALTAEDARGFVSLVEANNYLSLRSMTRLGYSVAGSIRATKFRGRWSLHHTGACADFGLAISESTSLPEK